MTTTATNRPATVAEVLDALAALAPTVADRAPDIEAARRIPHDLLDDLVSAGCFRLLLPRSHGGVEADLPAALRVIEALTRMDGSVGWTVMIGAGTWIDLAGLPRATFDSLYADGPDVMIAGAFAPMGVAVPVDGGYRVSGRWGFASGSPHARWIYGNCLEQSDDDAPRLRIALFAREEVELEDTWYVVGLRGTASHHFHVDDVVVPTERTVAVMHDPPSLDTPIVRIPPPALFATAIASAAVGIAQGALDEITELATAKQPLLSPTTLSSSSTFHHDLADADTALRAARALLQDSAEEAWATASDSAEFTLDLRARLRAAAASTVSIAADVVTTAYRAGGGTAIYLDSPLQRRLRDVFAVTQHFLVRPDVLTTAGGAFCGLEPDVPVF